MGFRSIAVVAAILNIVIVTRASERSFDERLQAGTPLLPAGAGKEAVAKFCDDCHGLATTVARRHLSSEWRELLDKMYVNGLSVNDDEDAKIFAYLTDQFGKVDLNNGSVQELRSALEITKEQADAVIAARPFAVVADLSRVNGFDDKKIAALRDRIVITPAKASIKKLVRRAR